MRFLLQLLIVGTLWGCASAPLQSPPASSGTPPSGMPQPAAPGTPAGGQASTQSTTQPRPVPMQQQPGMAADDPTPPAPGPSILQAKSRWIPARWADLPGWEQDSLHEAWNAWLQSCERPSTALANLCHELRRLSLASGSEQRAWIQQRLQPYRVEPLSGVSDGLLTGYYEPVFHARRTAGAGFGAALYATPLNWASRKPWYSRHEMDILPEARAALQGRAIAYLADPVDALVLQIQGSGKLRITEQDGSVKTVRAAYAGTNDQPYKSVGRWLLDQGLIKDASWPGIKAWITANPKRVNELLWSNPRVVFFKEEALSEATAGEGPKGAQGVPLTAGRSIAVDAGSIPYGTPVWLASSGAALNVQRLVLAQDTGSAIIGAVRADYYVGSGLDAGELAGRLKQPLRLWVLWPKP
jgi:membrane-bound lytic murein transglycosylase A